ncbi:hypothetical protein C8Q78DRAFT_1064332 [Trametes maxima]|nr:hypothetical protein C8Q78DRAFT_1064332 [Trametes maxima]
MSGLPPQLDSAQPGTPSREWARSTTTAAFSRTEPAPALSSAPSGTHTSIPPTSAALSMSAADSAQKGAFDPSLVKPTPASPGAQFPGAYPPTPGEQAAAMQAPVSMDAVRDTAQNAAGTASGFVQSAAQTAAQYLPQGVVDTVSAYMPTSSATSTMTTARASEHDAEHTTSFPTKEISGASASERTGGVGSLPGPVTESAVPKLPEEREEHERYTTAAGAAAALAAGAYAAKDRVFGAMPSAQDTEPAKDTVQQKAQGTARAVHQAIPSVPGVTGSRTTAVTASTVPTRGLFGAQPGDHSSGAGALPGDQDEPHVARLPEESVRPQFDSGPMDTAAQVALKPSEETFGNDAAVGEARHVGGVGALIGDRDESSVAVAPDERAGPTAAGAIGSVSRSVPTQEVGGNEAPGAPKHVGGVGALVGGRSESGVGVLPDERVQQRGTGTGTVTHPSTGKQALPMTQPKGETPTVPSPQKEERKTSQSTDEKAKKSGHHGQPNKGPGYDTDYHPAELHPPTETHGDPASEGEKSLGATQADADRPSEEAQPPHQTRDGDDKQQQKAKKAGFMDKMKGEAKVLLGKIEGKHEKVEQGKQIKVGETPTAA